MSWQQDQTYAVPASRIMDLLSDANGNLRWNDLSPQSKQRVINYMRVVLPVALPNKWRNIGCGSCHVALVRETFQALRAFRPGAEMYVPDA